MRQSRRNKILLVDSESEHMSKDDAIRFIFVEACRDFRSAQVEERAGDADRYLLVTNALEAAYPVAVEALQSIGRSKHD